MGRRRQGKGEADAAGEAQQPATDPGGEASDHRHDHHGPQRETQEGEAEFAVGEF